MAILFLTLITRMPLFFISLGTGATDIADNFLYATAIDELPPTESRLIPVRITSETSAGTGQFKIIIQDVTENEEGTLYDSKTFFITVTG